MKSVMRLTDFDVNKTLETIPIEIVYYTYKDSYLERVFMDSNNFIDKAMVQITNFFEPDKERLERLRVILEKQQNRQVSTSEAEEVGCELISFYECLASDQAVLKNVLEVNDV